MALIPPFFMDCVVAIGAPDEKKEKVWIGTGFLVGKLNEDKEEGKRNYSPYLVTNKHVLQDLEKIVVRFNPQTDQASKDFIIDAVDDDKKEIWTGHPTKDFDVAVIRLNGEVLEKEGLKFGLFTDDKTFVTKEKMQDKEITEGDFIYVLGFPMGLVNSERQHVIVRNGCLARIRDLYENRSNDFLVDAVVFPGNSGGPVIIKPEAISISGTKANKEAGLIGIIKSYMPYQDMAISQQTKQPRIIFEENSGLSVVEPVDHIIETIEEDEKRKMLPNSN